MTVEEHENRTPIIENEVQGATDSESAPSQETAIEIQQPNPYPEQSTPVAEEDEPANDAMKPSASAGGEENLTLEEAQAIIAQLRDGNRHLRDKYLRSHADFENFKRRTERDTTARMDEARMVILRDCLDIVDNFDRAMEAIDDPSSPFAVGVRMIHKQFGDFLNMNHVTEIQAAGRTFDPYLHEALAKESVLEIPENTITAVFQKGYRFKNKLLRAAQVKVAVHPDDQTASASDTGTETPAADS